MDFLTTGYNLFLIVLGFCLLIALHELGHFAAAKWAGIRVHVFAIGMGRVLVSWRRGIGATIGSTERIVRERFGKSAMTMSDAELAEHGLGETEYSLRLLPIGGFVGMLGQDDFDPSARSEDPRSYQRTPVGKRLVVVSAGVIMNLIVAVALFVVAFMVGVKFEAPVIGGVGIGAPAAHAVAVGSAVAPGLQAGDRIISIDGEDVRTFADIQIAAALSKPGQPLRIVVDRPGQSAPLTFDAAPERDKVSSLRALGIIPARDTMVAAAPATLAEVEAALQQSGLASQGVAPGWSLSRVNGTVATTAEALNVAARESHGAPLRTQWTSADGARHLDATLPVSPELRGVRVRGRGGDKAEDAEILLGLSPLVRVAEVNADSPNRDLLKPGDVILSINAVDGPSLQTLQAIVADHVGKALSLRVLRDGAALDLTAHVGSDSLRGISRGKLGIVTAAAFELPVIAAPTVEILTAGPDSSAPAASSSTPITGLGLEPFMRIGAVNGTKIQDWNSLRLALADATRSGAETKVTLTVTPFAAPAEPRDVTLTLSHTDVEELQALSWRPELREHVFDPLFTTLSAHGNPVEAAAMGFQQTERLVLLNYLMIDRLFRGTVAVTELHGPVGIVHLGTRVADRGFLYLVFFLALISVSLAVLNFLPLPIVDGGLFLFLIYEKIRGRPPSVRFQNMATAVGLCLIVGLFLLASYNDVVGLLRG